MYHLLVLPHAQKDLDRIPSQYFKNIKIKILQLADNPRPFGSIKLTNEEGYRIRVGTYRVLYRIEDKSKEIFIYRIKHRKDAY